MYFVLNNVKWMNFLLPYVAFMQITTYLCSEFKNKPQILRTMKRTTNDQVLQKYTKEFINKEYLIKVYGIDNDGKKINKLVGVDGILKLIGARLFESFVDRAERDMLDKTPCKLRRGLMVTLYVH